MNHDSAGYDRLCELCDDELAAADQADSNDARIEHLEQAFRFAQRASKEGAARPTLTAHFRGALLRSGARLTWVEEDFDACPIVGRLGKSGAVVESLAGRSASRNQCNSRR